MESKESFNLSPRLPFRLDLTVWTLRRRQKNQIDKWSEGKYSRVLVINNTAVLCQVTQTNNKLKVTTKSDSTLINSREFIEDTLKTMLGIDIDTSGFLSLAQSNAKLSALAQDFTGMKPPRFPTLFEALVNAISCQQVSLDLGILLLNRLCEKFGKKFTDGKDTQYAFPRPEDLEHVSEDDIKQLGFSYQKSRAILGLSQLLLDKTLSFEKVNELSNEEAATYFTNIKGIGRWSAEYAMLRGLGRLDILPGDDVGAQKNLKQLFCLEKRPNYEEIKELTSPWQPYAGLIYFHLLLEKLQEKGLL
jgi:DNA-3-methyladenine glycosylase II